MKTEENAAPVRHEPLLVCGIVMPISTMDVYSEAHWLDVRGILISAIGDAGFHGNMVSEADDVGVIHKRIIQNLYDNPIVVCDVSGRNPNVMFELGMRLAFDKPTIIVKDDATNYTFDTSAIEHIEYPRDLRFGKIVDFKRKLTEKIISTHRKATDNKDFTPFLKHFGEFKVAKLEKKEVSSEEFLLEELRSIRVMLSKLQRDARIRGPGQLTQAEQYALDRERFNKPNILEFCLGRVSEENLERTRQELLRRHDVAGLDYGLGETYDRHLFVTLKPNSELTQAAIQKMLHGTMNS